MKTRIQLYDKIRQKVQFLYTQLQLDRQEKTKGRKLALPITDSITLSIFKQKNHIATKKSVYEIFDPPCSYKTLVVNMNRFARLAMILLTFLLNLNRASAHPIKHTDATDIPVCTNRKAKHHKTMQGLASWKKTGKGSFYGLKLHITTDLKRKLLSFRFTSGKVDDRKVFMRLNKGLMGIFVADAGYISQKLQDEFYVEHKRILFVRPRANMKKLITAFQYHLYNTRVLIELNFRNLKLFYGLVSSLPRSVSGYLANYTYSLLAYQIA
jgi:hypothetical protein